MGEVSRWTQFILSTPVVLWAGWPFFVRGARSLRTRHFNMFTLIAIGVGAALRLQRGGDARAGPLPARRCSAMGGVGIYFEAAAVIIVLVLLGQVLELRARSRTGSAIRALLDLAPATARLVENGDERGSAARSSHGRRPRFACGPAKRCPSMAWSSKAARRSMNPCSPANRCRSQKAEGDGVTGGTINGTGSFLLRAERVGSETVLAQIVHMVAEAQRSRAPIQALADKVAGYFVPAVLAIAVLTFVAVVLFRAGAAAGATPSSTPSPCSSSRARARSGSPRRCRSWSASDAARRRVCS